MRGGEEETRKSVSAAVDQDRVVAGVAAVIRGDGVEAGVVIEAVETGINHHMSSKYSTSALFFK